MGAWPMSNELGGDVVFLVVFGAVRQFEGGCVFKCEVGFTLPTATSSCSVLQGEDLHARLIAPRGVVIKTSVQLEKSKLEDEVKRLQVKISDLER